MSTDLSCHGNGVPVERRFGHVGVSRGIHLAAARPGAIRMVGPQLDEPGRVSAVKLMGSDVELTFAFYLGRLFLQPFESSQLATKPTAARLAGEAIP